MLNSDGLKKKEDYFSNLKSYIVNPCSIFKNKIFTKTKVAAIIPIAIGSRALTFN